MGMPGIIIALHIQCLSQGWRAPNPPVGQRRLQRTTPYTTLLAQPHTAQRMDRWTDGPCGSAGTIANVAHHHLTWGDIPSPAEGQGPAPSPFPSSLSHKTRLFDLAQEPLAIRCGGQGDAHHPGQLLHPLLPSQLQGMFLHPSPPPPASQGASGGSGSALPPSPRQSGGSSTR